MVMRSAVTTPNLDRWERIRCTTSALKLQRVSYESQWRDIQDFLLPYRLRLQLTDNAKGDRRNQQIYDSTASMCVRTGEAGMMGGVTSPADKWFRLFPKDSYLAESRAVREWCDQVTDLMLAVLDNSNVYLTLPPFYGNLMGFATAAMSIEEDFSGGVIHARTFAQGSYWIGQDSQSNVVVFYREFRWTVRQVYEKFGKLGTLSAHIQSMVDRGDWEQWVDVAQIVYPNEKFRIEGGFQKRFSSCWFEVGCSSTDKGYERAEGVFLQEGGFDSFPFLVGRWTLTEGDVYGIDCPGMTSIGDIKSLQRGEKRAWQAVDKWVNPHWLLPSSLKNRDTSFLPGEHTFVDERAEMKGARPLYEINPQIDPLTVKQNEVRQRIREAFYYDLFRMLDMLEDRDRTATEIAERKEEKLAQLVPTLGQLNRGVLKPMLDRTFQIMMRQGLIPPWPKELAGQKLDYEYLGILAQAQRALKVAPIERGLAFVGNLAGMFPEVRTKIDAMQAVDEVWNALGAASRVLRSDDEVAQIQAQQAQAAQQQALMQNIPQLAGAAKDLSQAQVSPDKNALQALLKG